MLGRLLGKESVPGEVLSSSGALGMESWPQTTAGKTEKKVVQEIVRDYLG